MRTLSIASLLLLLFLVITPVKQQVVKQELKLEKKVLKVPAVDPEELMCLAQNMYHEARGEGVLGMLAVGLVTINRQKDRKYPNSICGVVFQENQFSWVGFKPLEMYHLESRNLAISLAKELLNGRFADLTNGAKWFHSIEIRTPKWAKGLSETVTLGKHRFYKESENEIYASDVIAYR